MACRGSGCVLASRAGARRGGQARVGNIRRRASTGASRVCRYRLDQGRQRVGRRRRLRAGAQRGQTAVPVLGCQVVPALQPAAGDAVQPPGLHRTLPRFSAGLRRWRQPGRAKARRAVPRARLPDHGAVQPARRGADAPARRGRHGPVHPGVDAGHERATPTHGGTGRSARRRQGFECERLAAAGLLFLGNRRIPARAQEGIAGLAAADGTRLPGRSR